MSLAALALAAVLAQQPPPLACPPGTRKQGAEPTDGYDVWCEGKDELGLSRREGPARRYYDDGKVWIEEAYRAGQRDGPFVEYHRNGVRAREGRYARGLKVGLWTIRWESGALEEEAEFRQDVPHGRFAAYRSDGTKRTEGRRCGGAPCGTWRTFGPDGRVESESRYEEPRLDP